MAQVFLICGKICSGKSYYAEKIRDEKNAVILSTDEATKLLIDNQQGEFYNEFAKRVNLYLRRKAVEIAKAGTNVILDWGFWTKSDREEIRKFLSDNKVQSFMLYIDISDTDWERNIKERNERIEQGEGGSDFYVDEGLKNKVLSLFEIPTDEECNLVIQNSRE